MVGGITAENTKKVAAYLRNNSYELNDSSDLDQLMNVIGDAHYVLLGEASHGTHEYYAWRSRITKRLIAEKNFSFIAVEGDWPDCYRINRYIKGYDNTAKSSREVTNHFNRWPTWMWANWEVVALAEWLHKHNQSLPSVRKVGFYGLDVYSLHESLNEIAGYLKNKDNRTLRLVDEVLTCFEPFGYESGAAYARATYDLDESCRDEVVNLLASVRRNMPHYNTDREAVFSTEQNALIAVNAEHYYRSMMDRDSESWNTRDGHMTDTLNRLMAFHGANAKAVVWEHNTHIGDARATDMKENGMFNLGQLVSEQHDYEGVVRVGFGSYWGSVIAAAMWGGQMQKMQAPTSPKGSWEHLLHETGRKSMLILPQTLKNTEELYTPIGHRAIGVVYHPKHEQYGNYVASIIPLRYEVFIYFDQTTAVHPLHIKPDGHLIPETYPWGD